VSRAFVKEEPLDPGEPVRRQASGRPNYVTASGLELLKARAADLAALCARLAAARPPGEPRGLELRQAEADLAYFQERLRLAKLVDNMGLQAPDIRFGAAVRLRGRDGEKNYLIVGEDEADGGGGRINWASPLALALIGKKAGAALGFGGAGPLEILQVSYPPRA
jgi:transcription elongation factor GreB